MHKSITVLGKHHLKGIIITHTGSILPPLSQSLRCFRLQTQTTSLKFEKNMARHSFITVHSIGDELNFVCVLLGVENAPLSKMRVIYLRFLYYFFIFIQSFVCR